MSRDIGPDGGPRKELLDAVCGNRPTALVVRDEHAARVSTAALERAGITHSTPAPIGGRIERDRSGSPTGVLHEGAMALLDGVKPAPSSDDLDTALVAGHDGGVILRVEHVPDAGSVTFHVRSLNQGLGVVRPRGRRIRGCRRVRRRERADRSGLPASVVRHHPIPWRAAGERAIDRR